MRRRTIACMIRKESCREGTAFLLVRIRQKPTHSFAPVTYTYYSAWASIQGKVQVLNSGPARPCTLLHPHYLTFSMHPPLHCSAASLCFLLTQPGLSPPGLCTCCSIPGMFFPHRHEVPDSSSLQGFSLTTLPLRPS